MRLLVCHILKAIICSCLFHLLHQLSHMHFSPVIYGIVTHRSDIVLHIFGHRANWCLVLYDVDHNAMRRVSCNTSLRTSERRWSAQQSLRQVASMDLNLDISGVSPRRHRTNTTSKPMLTKTKRLRTVRTLKIMLTHMLVTSAEVSKEEPNRYWYVPRVRPCVYATSSCSCATSPSITSTTIITVPFRRPSTWNISRCISI